MVRHTIDSLSVEEMRHRFDGEWVLVGDPVTSDTEEVLAGHVLWHSPDRDEVYAKAIELAPRSSAFLCFAPRPANVDFIL